jgi:hypothetical protein
MSKETEKIHDIKLDAIISELVECRMCITQIENFLREHPPLLEKARQLSYTVGEFKEIFTKELERRKPQK